MTTTQTQQQSTTNASTTGGDRRSYEQVPPYHHQSNPDLIALDWGTSSFRGWLLDGEGNVLDSISADLGILRIPYQDFESVYHPHIFYIVYTSFYYTFRSFGNYMNEHEVMDLDFSR